MSISKIRQGLLDQQEAGNATARLSFDVAFALLADRDRLREALQYVKPFFDGRADNPPDAHLCFKRINTALKDTNQ